MAKSLNRRRTQRGKLGRFEWEALENEVSSPVEPVLDARENLSLPVCVKSPSSGAGMGGHGGWRL